MWVEVQEWYGCRNGTETYGERLYGEPVNNVEDREGGNALEGDQKDADKRKRLGRRRSLVKWQDQKVLSV